MHAVAEAALEAVLVQQLHEELKVLLLAVVGGGGEEQEVAGKGREHLSQVVALGVLDLVAKEGGRHLVGLVAYYQVPAAVAGLEQRLAVLVAGQLVHARYGQRRLREPVACSGRLQLVVGHDLKRQLEPPVELILPLLGQAAGTHHQAALQVSADFELLYQQSRHDGLSGAGIVCQKKPEGLAGQHRVVYGRDLVGQRLHIGCVDGKDGIKEVGQLDSPCLGGEAEEVAVPVKRPLQAASEYLEAGLVIPVEEAGVHASGVRHLVGEAHGGPAEPLDRYDLHGPVGRHSENADARSEVFQPCHAFLLLIP